MERFSAGVEIHITPPNTPLNANSNTSSAVINQRAMTIAGGHLIHRNVSKNLIQQQQQQQAAFNDTMIQQTSKNSYLKSTPIVPPSSSSSSGKNLADETIQNINDKTGFLMNRTIASSSSLNTQQMMPPPSSSQPTSMSAPPSASAASQQQQRTLLPRPIMNPNRTFFDKVLDFIIGEGPNNR